MRLVALAAAAALLAAPAPADAGACMTPSLGHEVLSPRDAVMPRDGGVLVGWTRGQGGADDVDAGTDPTARPWRFTVGGVKQRARRVALAPGLSVYRPSKLKRGKAKVRLVGAGAAFAVTVAGKAAKLAMPAPVVKEVSRTQTPQQRAAPMVVNAAQLDAPAPDDAIAVIVYEVDDAGAATARSWTRVAAGETGRLTLYQSPGRCGVAPPAMQEAYKGSWVELRWVDRWGRLSPPSTKLQVTGS